MCVLCDEGRPRKHFGSRRNFLKGAAATGLAAAGLNLFTAHPVARRTTGTRPRAAAARAGATSFAAVP